VLTDITGIKLLLIMVLLVSLLNPTTGSLKFKISKADLLLDLTLP